MVLKAVNTVVTVRNWLGKAWGCAAKPGAVSPFYNIKLIAVHRTYYDDRVKIGARYF